MALEKQVHIYSVDTGIFYYDDEFKIHKQLSKLYNLRYRISTRRKKEHKNKDIEDTLYIDQLYTRIGKLINNNKSRLYELFNKNKGKTRILREDLINENNIVSIFDSSLTRIANMKINELSNDLVIVQTYFFQILEDITYNGFYFNNDKYIIYTASAGQIRTKKTVFIKESMLRKYENALTCGLTDDIINNRGTININKYLAYRALQNSATDLWEGFDIDKSIVVDDFETNVLTEVDYIDDETYEIKRVKMEVPIPHTDGAGIMLPSLCDKNRMVRAPWMKGLLIPFDFRLFISEFIDNGYPDCYKIKDIYGKEYDIIKDDIQVIFTKSQFKMYKFYKSWEEYKYNFKKYGCEVGYCNEEEDRIRNATINYQMLQTLTDITNDELVQLSKKTNDDIYKISSDKDTMLKLLGATPDNYNKNYLQQAIQYYPQLLNDSYSKDVLKQIRRSLVKKAKSGKLSIDCKYTFICPDVYAFAEWLFLGIDNPKGLIGKDEVSCNLYNNNKELDCLRSPHLFLEHCVRNNKVEEKQKKWFITKGFYTSVHDIISKILQFDVDGDKSLVCGEKLFVKIAKRNIEKMNVVPLYYNMKKADSMKVDSKTIYMGMISAYKGGNIGLYSNDISKNWNSENIDLDVIKLLCMENNFVIDYAKTLYKPTRPKWAKEKISQYTKNKLPYFFISAKDKTKQQVEIRNDSTVNKLNKIIKNPKLDFESIGEKFDYKMLLNNKRFKIDKDHYLIIEKYNDLDLKSSFMVECNDNKQRIKELSYKYKSIREEFMNYNYNINILVDILVKYLYTTRNNNKKVMLWECFGDIILKNIINNISHDFKNKYIECKYCGKIIEKVNKNTKYCEPCHKKYRKEYNKKYK